MKHPSPSPLFVICALLSFRIYSAFVFRTSPLSSQDIEMKSSARVGRPYEEFPGIIQEVISHVSEHPVPFVSTEMYYKSSDSLPPRKLSSLVEKVQKWKPAAAEADEMETGHSELIGPEQQNYLSVVKAVLFYALDALDESHNLVLPLSWPSPTPFGGPAIRGSAAAQDATLCHAMLHRREGDFIGAEAGLSGWDNASFWFSRVDRGHPVYPLLVQFCRERAKGEAGGQTHAKRKDSIFEKLGKNSNWSSSLLTSLVESGVCGGLSEEDKKEIEEVLFAEWKFLLDKCWGKLSRCHNSD
uniref:Uncharacterized protein n=1 Tax=Chromera velia CCMP2878 TaxID=1169474 RepID=A0A0G4H9Y1_9ALVE|mmetsp:Transcript_8508/g.16604  ORF Transcript_8508/g.16604 Transcript_8508/m.16604 type:complete len:299 (-) Transcript_8508:179-1075(-)|eukprot:Cvel_897.t1-p1 / transcript=Cvel_897.t1 / gene=Cvel_897 / organism=Chromera_velia_CCMP2878 / gene_product=hypothetical protein / transcript_product=hypothetical protein / location=Cvel_scaffold28:97931-100716(+) / protein_length=298 / sequence_SO=supercontig / SO=protein_coding / is_pseudo=false